jgi:CubicO group peptidase (beta-lactamase class C family)
LAAVQKTAAILPRCKKHSVEIENMKRRSFRFLANVIVILSLTGIGCGSGGNGGATPPPTTSSIPTTGPDIPGAAAYDNAIIPVLKKWNIPGAALAVTKNGRLILVRGYGYADVENKIPVQPDSIFRIASISKPITATAILHLVDQRKLDLDAKFLDILTDLTVPANADARLRQITIRHLLEHAGGWDRDKSALKCSSAPSCDPMFMSVEIAGSLNVAAPASCRDVIQYMMGKPLDFNPGTKYAYSNFGFCILGRVIEKVTGQPYEVYVRENVLAPMDIHAMRIGRTMADGRAPGEVKYYDYPGAPSTPSVFPGAASVPMQYGGYNLEAMDAHGGWIASPIDLVRFMSALDGRRGSGFLSANSLLEMTARPDVPVWETSAYWYGLGLLVRPAEVDANWWHNGALRGGTTLLVRSYNGYEWTLLLNSRPEDTRTIDSETDRAMWNALGSGLQGSPTDLFLQYPSPSLPPGLGTTKPAAAAKVKEH